MKTIQIFVVTLLCLITIQVAQANTSPLSGPGDPCPCCKKCDDKKCQEMCATVTELRKDPSKKAEADKVAAQCEEHCKTTKCDMKKAKNKSCCSTH